MPIYEFECPKHGRFELFLTIYESSKEFMPCQKVEAGFICNRDSEKVWSVLGNVQIGKPSPIFRNPRTGEVRTAVSEYERPPSGFIREDLKGPIERSKFEKEENERNRARNESMIFHRKSEDDLARKARREDTDAKMSSIVSKTDNPSATKALILAARNRKKKERKQPVESQFKFVVNHSDSSNINKA